MQEMVRDNRVEHAHATFIEHTHDGFALFEALAEVAANFFIGGRKLHSVEIFDVALIVSNASRLKPFTQAGRKIRVGEVLAPKSAVPNARFGHGTIEVQHADEPWPCAAPIGDRQDGATVRSESMEHL